MSHRINRRMSRPALAALAVAGVLIACAPDAPVDVEPPLLAAARAGHDEAGVHRQYGVPIALDMGKVRTYVVLDEKAGRRPLEIGIAIDAAALEGALPQDGRHMFQMQLPQHAPAPYEFVMFDWNPQGHVPPGVYDIPHFDFHFYFTTQAEVLAIDPADSLFAAKANNLPSPDYFSPWHILPLPPGAEPAQIAAPFMGLHWEDSRDPQLQRLLGNPDGYAPFTKTFIYGSWDGRVTFLEPMITREYLLRRVNEIVPIEPPARVPEPGWYPSAYQMTYDAQAGEYRVALIGLVQRH